MSSRGPILHIAPFLWSGAGSVITRLCEDQRRDDRVVIVTTSRADGLADWPAYRRRLRRAGVEHRAINVFHRDAPRFWEASRALAGLIRDLRPRVIHAHAGVPTCCALVARDVARVPVRVVAQMYSWGTNRPAWMDWQDLWGFARADRVVSSAHFYRDVLVEGGVRPSRLTYLPWGLPLADLPYRGIRRAATAGETQGPRLGFVGRIEPRKGQVALVEAFRRVRTRFPSATLELVGPPGDLAYARQLHERVAAPDLRGAVTVTGMVGNVVSHLRTWDLFVSLSSDEGQGLAVLEAMATGVPVLARPVAGISDFLQAGTTGLTVRDAGASSVGKAIVAAVEDPEMLARLARTARRLVERSYDWSKTVKALARIYAS